MTARARVTRLYAVHHQEHGFSLLELLVSIAVLTVVTGTALNGLMGMTKTSATIANRTEMHAGVRNATELLQQEVGQAGRIALPGSITATANIAVDATSFTVSSVANMFVGEYLIVGAGGTTTCLPDGCEETVMIKTINTATNQIAIETDSTISKGNTAFAYVHTAGAPVRTAGGFGYGVVPPSLTNGSTDSVLKIFGDINSDGEMVYIEYVCDVEAGNLYRRAMPIGTATKSAITPDLALLNNVVANPDGTDCFTYQEEPVSGVMFVVDVAITLTVRTTDRDPQTGLYQKETKALLNVSPRNVFNVWQLAGLGLYYRVQPMPPSVSTLIAAP